MKRFKEYSLVLGSLIVIISVLFREVIDGSKILFSGDAFSAQAIKKSISSLSEFPDWYPYIFSGLPTVGSFLSIQQLYFPHHIVSFLHENLSLPWIWNFLFHYIFGGIGMYLLLKFLKQNILSAIFGALLFTTLPYMVAYLVHGHGSQVMTAVYIPWVLLFLFKIYKQPNLINFSLLALLIGLQLLRGHIQIAYYTWMMVGLYILIQAFISYKKNKSYKELIKSKLFVLSSIVMGLLTSLSLYLPTLEFTSLSSRGGTGIGIEKATEWSLSLRESLTFILPYIHGFGGFSYLFNENHGMRFTDFPNYLGLVVIILAIIGLLKSKIDFRYKLFFALSIIFSFLLALGENFITFYELFYNYLPFFNKFRVPIYFLIITQFSIIVLAACGLTKFVDLLKKNYKLASILISIILIIFLFLKPTSSEEIKRQYIPSSTEYFEYKLNELDNMLLNSPDSKNLLAIQKKIKRKTQDLDISVTRFLDHPIFIYKLYTQSSNKKLHDFNIILDKTVISNKDRIILTNLLNEINIILSNELRNSYEVEFSKEVKFNDNLILYNQAINRDYLIIIFFLFAILIFSIATPKLNGFFKNEYLICFIIIYCLFTNYRVNRDIINPTYHATHKAIIQDSNHLSDFFQEDGIVDYLKEHSKGYRVLDLRMGNGNKLAAFNIETITGYHAVKLSSYNMLYMNQFDFLEDLDWLNESLFARIQNQKGGRMLMERFFDLFEMSNVKYIVLNSTLHNNPNLQQVYIDAQSRSYIYELKNHQERVYFVNNQSVKYDANPEKDWNLRDNIYVERTTNHINNFIDNSENGKGNVTIIDKAPGFIEFQTECDSEQFLFISELDYPGWKLYNKNNPNDIHKLYKVNKSFMGFIAPSGSHSFILKFQSNSSKTGLIISYISYLILLILLILGVYFKQKKNINESL